MKRLISILTLIIAAASSSPAFANRCNDASLFGSNLITSICWSCLLPIRLFGASGNSDDPAGANTNPVCACADPLGVPQIGFTMGAWLPYRLFEVVRTPYCMPVLGGIVINDDSIDVRGTFSRNDATAATYHYHVHTWSFPLATMMELLVSKQCNPGGYQDMDVMLMTEFDPTASDDELSLFVYFETVLFANPASAAACSAECGLLSAGVKPESSPFFWCLGCWGPLYPLSTSDSGDFGFHAPTNALAARQLAVKHRRGMGHKTYGRSSLCGGSMEIFMPKAQYKWSQYFPDPEANGPRCCHWTGESQWVTGGYHRQIPAVGEDAVHMLWRYTDCCIH